MQRRTFLSRIVIAAACVVGSALQSPSAIAFEPADLQSDEMAPALYQAQPVSFVQLNVSTPATAAVVPGGGWSNAKNDAPAPAMTISRLGHFCLIAVLLLGVLGLAEALLGARAEARISAEPKRR